MRKYIYLLLKEAQAVKRIFEGRSFSLICIKVSTTTDGWGFCGCVTSFEYLRKYNKSNKQIKNAVYFIPFPKDY